MEGRVGRVRSRGKGAREGDKREARIRAHAGGTLEDDCYCQKVVSRRVLGISN